MGPTGPCERLTAPVFDADQRPLPISQPNDRGKPPMSKTIVFIHGAWVTPLCWEKFSGYFQAKGYQCLAPTWPHKDRTIAELRTNPPQGLKGLGVKEIVDHYDRAIRALPEPPILI